jgi:EAL domain-containing protein (putative c-di-GMP-specific phosphodiesterase class I)
MSAAANIDDEIFPPWGFRWGDADVHFAFQPVFQGNDVAYFEMLVRPRRYGVLIPADKFIAAIEQHNQTIDFDTQVLRHAIGMLAAHSDVAIGINVSGATASCPKARRSILSILNWQSPSVARRLVVEITETYPISDRLEAYYLADSLKHNGCRVALDDFGADGRGKHLTQELVTALSPTILKLDRDMLAGLLSDERKQTKLREIFAFCQANRITPVVEGIEDSDIADWVTEACPNAWQQGYYWGMPVLDMPDIKPLSPERPTTLTGPQQVRLSQHIQQ